MMREIGALLNGLCLALYETGLTALGTFFTNTRLIGVRDSPLKGPLLVAGVTVWPLAGLVDALASGGLGGFLRSLVGPRHGSRGFGVRLSHDALLLGDRPVRLLDLVREVEADLVDKLHQLVLVQHDLRRQRDVTRVLDQILETVKQLVDLYLNFSFNALATGGGTRSDTLPP